MRPARAAAPPSARAPVQTGLPLVGSLPSFRRDPLRFMTALSATHGPIAEIRLGPRPAVIVSGPEEIRQVLVSKADDFDKGSIQRRALVPTMRNGLLISEGEIHATQRRLLVPYFAARRTGHYVETFAACAQEHARRMVAAGEVDLLSAMGGITRDVVGRILWSGSLDDEQDLAAAVTRVFEWEMHNLFALAPAPVWFPNSRNRQMQKDITFVRNRIQKIIDRRLDSGERVPDLLGALLEARYEDGSTMDGDQLLDEIITLWGAAHETSADAQFWTAYLLGRHAEVRERVQAEVDTVLGDALPGPDDLERLPYTLQVFKESMRMFPPAASLLREAIRDTEISGFPVVRGTVVFISTYAMHRNPEHYPEPDRFEPDRFTPTAERARPRFAYLPFGAGPHVCIGSHLALTEGHVFTAVLARRLVLEVPIADHVEPRLLINLRPDRTVRAAVSPRRHDVPTHQ